MTPGSLRGDAGPRVCELIGEILGVEVVALCAETRIREDLGADSMQVIALMIALDEAFDVAFDVGEIPDTGVTVGWIVDFVALTLERQRPAG